MMLTGDFRTDVMNIALSQLGYHESDDEGVLDGMDPYGEEDYTEYGRYMGTNGTAWCTEFLSWCLAMAEVPESVIAIRLLEGNSDDCVMTEVMYVDASSGRDIEMEPDEDGNYLHIAAIITPEYEKTERTQEP